MNALRRWLAVALLGLAGQFGKAQEQATTLSLACAQASAVVVAEVVAATDPSPDWHRLTLRVQALFKGQLAEQFTLLEPAGACCGRSLFSLAIGDRRLLFLTQRGGAWHLFGGDRGMLAADPELLAHVQSLLEARTPAQQARVLLAALDQPCLRIARDAAFALAEAHELTLTTDDQELVAQSLQAAVSNGHSTTPALAEIALRAGHASLLQATFAAYRQTSASDQAQALRAALARHQPAAASLAALPMVQSSNLAEQLRGAELLAALPAADAAPCMQQLLSQPSHPRTKLVLAQGLLRAGYRKEHLAPLLPKALLTLALHQQRERQQR